MSIQANYSRRYAEIKAEEVLKQFSSQQFPVDPLDIANRNNIKVYMADFPDPKISGLIKKDGEGTSIYVKDIKYSPRVRFTLAHELGHYFMHLNDSSSHHFIDDDKVLYRNTEDSIHMNDNKEIEANQFATALLMPRDEVIRSYELGMDVYDMAVKFNVSYRSMEIRLMDLGIEGF